MEMLMVVKYWYGDADGGQITKTITIHKLEANKQRNNSTATNLTLPAVRPCEDTCYRRHVLPMSTATTSA
jgi:hypothetical protein